MSLLTRVKITRTNLAVTLPYEILAIIFENLVQDCDGSCPHKYDIRDAAEINFWHVSEVCFHWRSVALKLHGLWGKSLNIDLGGVAYTKEVIRKSGSAPLMIRSDVEVDQNRDRFLSAKWTVLLGHISRIKLLHVSFQEFCEIFPLRRVIQQPAPLLECCIAAFNVPVEEEERPVAVTLDPPNIGETPLFAGDAPNLRCLVVHAAVLPPLINISALNLVHLDISLDYKSSKLRLPLSSWLDMLAEQPMLRVLTLTDLVCFSTAYGHTARCVNLPQLGALYLSGGLVDCGALFGKLKFPPTCHIYLGLEQISFDSSMEGLVNGLQRALQSWDEHNGPECHYQWRVVHDHVEHGEMDNYFNISVGRTQLQQFFFCPQLTIDYNMCEDIIVDDCPLGPLLNSLLSARLSLVERPTKFLLRTYHEEIPFNLTNFLSSFKRVYQLILCGAVLENMVAKYLTSSPSSVMFPGLHSIVLDPPSFENDCEKSLQDYLGWRARCGQQVPYVVLLVRDGQPVPGEARDYFAKTLEKIRWRSFELATPETPRCSLCRYYMFKPTCCDLSLSDDCM